MKNILLAILILGTSFSTFAQLEIKTDALGLTYKNYALGYEYIINDNISVSITTKYILDNAIMESMRNLQNTDYSFSAMKIIPEFRYYFNPKLGGDGIFIGGYGIYKTEYFSDLVYVHPATNDKYDYTMHYDGQGLGLIGGYKLLTNSRFSFEGLIGIGRVTPYHIVQSSISKYYIGENYYYENNYISLWDIRIELNIGFRIGKMNKNNTN